MFSFFHDPLKTEMLCLCAYIELMHTYACISLYVGLWGYISPVLPQTVGGQAWVEKFVLNLCYLCFKVPEFVLRPTLRDKLISLGGLRKC